MLRGVAGGRRVRGVAGVTWEVTWVTDGAGSGRGRGLALVGGSPDRSHAAEAEWARRGV